MRADRRIVNAKADRFGAKPRAGAQRMRAVCRGKQSLCRQRTVIERRAAHPAFFDKHDIDAESRRRRGRGQSARACANDAEVGMEYLRD